MKKKNYFLAVVIALVMALSVSMFALSGCGGGDDHPADTSFEGSISAQSYTSADAAASAFIEEEINGNATSVTFVSYTKEADLSEEEIARLNLGTIDVATVTSVESGKVTFTENTRAAAGEKTARVYIVKVGDVYFYYVPIFERGELITKSYISDVLDYRKYLNVTETNVTTAKASVGKISQTATTKTVTKITENAVYYQLNYTTPLGTPMVEEIYIVVSNGSMHVFEKSGTDISWETSSTNEYASIPEFIEEMFKFDHSYFVKTNSGFELPAEKLTSFLNDVMEGLDAYGTVLSGSANYYVQEGKLDGASVKLSMSMTQSGMTMNTAVSGTTTYSDYGTTVVEIPAEITAMMND